VCAGARSDGDDVRCGGRWIIASPAEPIRSVVGGGGGGRRRDGGGGGGRGRAKHRHYTHIWSSSYILTVT